METNKKQDTEATKLAGLQTEELEKKLKTQKLVFNITLGIELLGIILYFYFGLIKDQPINKTFIVIWILLIIVVFSVGIKLDKTKKELKKRRNDRHR